MNIHAQRGDRVQFKGCSDDTVKFGSCADPRKILKEGMVYRVERTEIHSWHTKVFLIGIDCGRGFNSACFKDFKFPKDNG